MICHFMLKCVDFINEIILTVNFSHTCPNRATQFKPLGLLHKITKLTFPQKLQDLGFQFLQKIIHLWSYLNAIIAVAQAGFFATKHIPASCEIAWK